MRPIYCRGVLSAQSVTFMKAMLKECHSEHAQAGTCPQPVSFLPKRLVKIYWDDVAPMIRIYETIEAEILQWISLSYCWGADQTMKATQGNFDKLTAGISLASLPKTLQDAIFITYLLGLEYIWIDALCIIQDDDDDKANEISRMHDIYKAAFVTLIAASASRSTEGFLQDKSGFLSYPRAPKVSLRWRWSEDLVSDVVVCKSDGSVPTLGSTDPITSRAWTFQEHILSPRVIYFSETQIRWRCQDCDTYVGRPNPEKNDWWFNLTPHTLRSQDEFLKTWMRIVEAYSNRLLSEPMDKLVALSAVCHEIGTSSVHSYFAGLWKENLAFQLLWHRSSLGPWKLPQNPPKSRPSIYRAPSWSWASIDDAVTYPWNHSIPCRGGDYLSVITVLDCHVEPLYPQTPYGEVRSGLIRVQGRLLPVWRHCNRDMSLHGPSYFWRDSGPTHLSSMYENADTDEGFERPDFDDVQCLVVVENNTFYRGLVLKETAKPYVYRRFGYFENRKSGHGVLDFMSIEHAWETTITII